MLVVVVVVGTKDSNDADNNDDDVGHNREGVTLCEWQQHQREGNGSTHRNFQTLPLSSLAHGVCVETRQVNVAAGLSSTHSSTDKMRPPKPPPRAPPTAYTNKQSVENELDALRKRGLAKIFNKHFSSVAQTLASEKAAADAALKDLEERKARMKEHAHNPGEASALDSMYFELQQRKADCKRKEKETLMLYQRYVDKFGKSGVVAVPRVSGSSPSPLRTPSPFGTPKRLRRLSSPSLPQYPPVASPLLASANSKSTVDGKGTIVPELAKGIEDSIVRNVERGAERLPSVETLGIEKTISMEQATLEQQSRAELMRSLEAKGIDAKSTSSNNSAKLEPGRFSFDGSNDSGGPPMRADVRSSKHRPISSFDEIKRGHVGSMTTAGGYGSSGTNNNSNNNNDNDNDKELIDGGTGRTGVNAQTNGRNTVSEDVPSRTVDGSFPKSSIESGITEPLTDDASILSDERSTVSELTSVQSMVVSEAEMKLLDFLKTETEAIRRMMDEEDGMSVRTDASGGTNGVNSVLGSESIRAAEIAENMVRKMQTMLDEFQSNSPASGNVGDNTPDGKKRNSYPLETTDPDENWTVHWDDSYEREYYFNENTGASQWERPACAAPTKDDIMAAEAAPGGADYVPIADYTRRGSSTGSTSRGLIDPLDLKPEQRRLSTGTMSNRRIEYRRRQRRKRNRRRLLFAVVLACTGGGLYFGYQKHQTDPVFAEKVSAAMNATNLNGLVERAVAVLPESWTGEAERKAREEADRLRMELQALKLREQQEREARLQKEREELEARKRKEQAELEARQKKEREALDARKQKEREELAARQKKEMEEERLKEKKRKELERQALLKEAAEREKERKARERQLKQEAEQRAKEEAERRRIAEEERRLAEQERAREAEELREKLQQERIERLRKETMAAAAMDEEQRRLAQRPWHCNLPLLYIVNKNCRRLSSANPVFDLKDLVAVMMQ